MKTPIETLRAITEEQWLEIVDKSTEAQQRVLVECRERITNRTLYGNSWTNEELELVLKEKTNDN